jgi:hypothetical protein
MRLSVAAPRRSGLEPEPLRREMNLPVNTRAHATRCARSASMSRGCCRPACSPRTRRRLLARDFLFAQAVPEASGEPGTPLWNPALADATFKGTWTRTHVYPFKRQSWFVSATARCISPPPATGVKAMPRGPDGSLH